MRRIAAYLLIWFGLAAGLALPAVAQDDQDSSGGRLERLLQDLLSGENRQVQVIGLEGALTAKATIRQIVMSDDQGAWLTVNNATLDWNRLALVRGRFSVNTLTAEELIVSRKPGATAAPAQTASPEAQPFQVPELPVAIEIGELGIDRIELGEPVIGLAAELDLKGALQLADGTLDADLRINRLDREGDAVRLVAGYANETRLIRLDVAVSEQDDGLIATALKMPDSPPLRLTASGEGPVTDFTALISLSTDGESRLSGQVRLQAEEEPQTGDATLPGISFSASLGGDVTPLLTEEYQPFFGTQTSLDLDGRRGAEGRLEVEQLTVISDALDLNGQLVISAAGDVELVQLDGHVTPPGGGDVVVLPLTGPRTTLAQASVTANLDVTRGNEWSLDLGLDQLERPDLSIGKARITAGGALDQSSDLTQLQGRIEAALDGLAFDDDALNRAVGAGLALNGDFALKGTGALELSQVEFAGEDYSAQVDGRLLGLETGFTMDGTARVGAADLSRFSGLAGRDIGGAVTANVTGTGAPLGGQFDFRLDARAQDLDTGIEQFDPVLTGQTVLVLDAARNETGLTIDALKLEGSDLHATAAGVLRSQGSDLEFDARLDDLAMVFPEMAGPVTVSGDVAQDDSGTFKGTVNLAGPQSTFAEIDGTLAPDGVATADFDVRLARAELFVPQITGPVTASGTAERDAVGAITGDARLNGPLGSFAKLAGNYAPAGEADVTFDARFEQIERFVPQVEGTVSAKGKVLRNDAGTMTGLARLDGPHSSFANLEGTYTPGGAADVDFDAEFDQLERFVPELAGTLKMHGDLQSDAAGVLTGKVRADGPDTSFADVHGTLQPDGTIDVTYNAEFDRLERFLPELAGTLGADGTARREGDTWSFKADAKGPARIEADVGGTWNQATGDADIAATGQLELAAANRFLKPNSIIGPAQFDLTLKGKPGVDALAGTVTTSAARFAIPSVGQSVEQINSKLDIANGKAQIALTAALAAGGTFRVDGNAELKPPFNGTINTDIQQIVLTDNLSFDSSANGRLVYSGPLAGNANLSGRIDFGETNINLNTAAGAAGAAPIPPISHRGEPAAVRGTRDRAGLTAEKKSGSGPAIGLDLTLSAPNRVFARGFGVQAELGGLIVVRGTTQALAPAGEIELIRGHIDLLGRKLTLTDGLIALQGSLLPYIQFATTTSTSEGTATMEIAGPIDAPKVEVYSDPERPSEEAMAMLIFGNRFAELSPFALAQMVASLAKLRGQTAGTEQNARDATGADDIGVGVDDGNKGALGAGGYVLDNVYTDFTVNTAGDTEVNLNLDVSETITLKGTVDNTGSSSIGVFFEKDY